MKTKLAASAAIILSLAATLHAHRLDQYLQASMLTVEKNRVQVVMRLIPGVAVSQAVLTSIDINSDGVISESEQQAYAELVLRDVTLTVDGQQLNPRLVSVVFPRVADIKEGIGEIQFGLSANLPRGGSNRSLIFENHYASKIAVYLVNCLVPGDPNLRILAQKRDELQTVYKLDYAQADLVPEAADWSPSFLFHGFASMFHLGVRHIAEGTDHLLFLLTLLLPAPLLALGFGWGQFAGVRHCLSQSLKVVSAFTLGHSLTLSLAALGVVHVPSRPVEVLVAASILISAIHALVPLLPGREAAIAAFFGLIHGLAFASTLGSLGLGWRERVVSLLGFNVGIEAMQLVVVAATIPSLVLLGRTRAYSFFRIGGALFAAFASVGWILERMLEWHNPSDAMVETVARHALWLAPAFFLSSLICWLLDHKRESRTNAPVLKPV